MRRLKVIAERYDGALCFIIVSTSLSFMTDGKVDLMSRKRADTIFFSLHFWRTQEVRKRLVSSVHLSALPPKLPSAETLLFSAQKVILLVTMLLNILAELGCVLRYVSASLTPVMLVRQNKKSIFRVSKTEMETTIKER